MQARLFVISPVAETETRELFAAAAAARDVSCQHVDPERFDATEPLPTDARVLVYRAGTSLAAIHIEESLVTRGAIGFHRTSDDVHFMCASQPALLAAHGVPTPRTLSPIPLDRTVLMRHVAALGGFPLVLKALGGSYGVGVMRLDSTESLFSIVDYLAHHAPRPAVLCELVRHRVQYRLYVIGDRVVAALRQLPGPGDFRTNTEGRRFEPVPATDHAALQDLALRSCRALRIETGGVDVLAADDGRLLVTEVNFPAYIPRAQAATGVDIAGAMIDHLLSKA